MCDLFLQTCTVMKTAVNPSLHAVGEESDKARAAWPTRTKTMLCACARASLRLRPGSLVPGASLGPGHWRPLTPYRKNHFDS